VIEIDAWEKADKPKYFRPRLVKLCKKLGIHTDIVPLKDGDVRFLGAGLEIIRIERKSTNGDFTGSAKGRLVDQCLRMLDSSDVAILLIDGPQYLTKDGFYKVRGMKSGWKHGAIWNMLMTLQEKGLRIYESPTASYTPQATIDLYRYFQKTEHTSLLESKLKPFSTSARGLTRREQRIRVLMACKGVGSELATRLLEVYGSVTGVGSAPAEGLAAIPGVGKKKAETLKEILS